MATSKKSAAPAVSQNVTAIVPIQYSGLAVAIGEAFDCAEDDLVQLLEVGAVTVNADAAE